MTLTRHHPNIAVAARSTYPLAIMNRLHRWIAVAALAGGVFVPLSGRAQNAPATMPATQPSTSSADVAQPKLDRDGNIEARFQKKHASFIARAKEGKIGVLFLGDSITEGWDTKGRFVWANSYAKMFPANFGISGDKTQHVLWRIENGELDGISPKVLVLMIGTNNIDYPAEDILAADEKIVREIHEKLPDTRLLLLGIFPRGADPNDPQVAVMREKIKTVNQGLAKLEDGDKTRFLDIGDKFLDAQGNLPKDIMPDALHPNAKGYQIWADAMQPLLDEMMK
jgi:lysophospholipase L1-like esterase